MRVLIIAAFIYLSLVLIPANAKGIGLEVNNISVNYAGAEIVISFSLSNTSDSDLYVVDSSLVLSFIDV